MQESHVECLKSLSQMLILGVKPLVNNFIPFLVALVCELCQEFTACARCPEVCRMNAFINIHQTIIIVEKKTNIDYDHYYNLVIVISDGSHHC